MHVLTAAAFAGLSVAFAVWMARKFYKGEVPLNQLNDEYFAILDKERQRG